MSIERLVENILKEAYYNMPNEFTGLSVSKLKSLINDSGLAFKKTEDGSLSRRRVCIRKKREKLYKNTLE